MTFNEVEIYFCKFFTLNEDKELVFWCGKYKGKAAKDFTELKEILGAVNYCFWIIKKEDIKLVSKYTASAFLKQLTSKFTELEKRLRKVTIKEQKEMREKTEELAKTTGKKYI